jgi:hypothetical protein
MHSERHPSVNPRSLLWLLDPADTPFQSQLATSQVTLVLVPKTLHTSEVKKQQTKQTVSFYAVG